MLNKEQLTKIEVIYDRAMPRNDVVDIPFDSTLVSTCGPKRCTLRLRGVTIRSVYPIAVARESGVWCRVRKMPYCVTCAGTATDSTFRHTQFRIAETTR